MKAVVEWGIPQLDTKAKVCGISGFFVAENPKQAAFLATQIWHVHTQEPYFETDQWVVRKGYPRTTLWSSTRDFWVTVSLLDGSNPGAYAARAKHEQKVTP